VRWAALGFAVGEDGGCDVGAIRLQLGTAGEGICGWALRDVAGGSIDGLRTVASGAPRRESAPPQPNGIVGVDHVVVATPDFARTTTALAEAGLQLRRVREAGGTAQQGFYVLGDAVLEVVGPLEPDGDGPALFWGLTLVAADLDATCAALGEDMVGAPRDAVQPGRRIATLRRAAGLGTAVALMSPLPDGQTISQPLVVGRMVELLELAENDRVLDVGGGSGWHAAVIAQLAAHVWSIERHGSLVALARENLARAGVENVTVVQGDGTLGWPAEAPYDAINVAAGARGRVPPALEEQLADGGRLVAPVDDQLVVERRRSEAIERERLEGVRFVPLVGAS
jgi:protein-L-isoaspartate(D-aspartate) O-methyltransferase